MKKNAFTLIELLTVIIILSFIALIAGFVVGKIIIKSKQQTLSEQIKLIERSSEKWGIANTELLPNNVGGVYKLKLSDLKKTSYYLDKDVINPVTNARMNGCIHIKLESGGKHWTYTYVDSDIECAN